VFTSVCFVYLCKLIMRIDEFSGNYKYNCNLDGFLLHPYCILFSSLDYCTFDKYFSGTWKSCKKLFFDTFFLVLPFPDSIFASIYLFLSILLAAHNLFICI